jgi:hypothetical protein
MQFVADLQLSLSPFHKAVQKGSLVETILNIDPLVIKLVVEDLG